jgi:hypothetical protein
MCLIFAQVGEASASGFIRQTLMAEPLPTKVGVPREGFGRQLREDQAVTRQNRALLVSPGLLHAQIELAFALLKTRSGANQHEVSADEISAKNLRFRAHAG